MQKEIPTGLIAIAVVLVVGLIVFFFMRSGQPPHSGNYDHTKWRAPAGLPQPPWVKDQPAAGATGPAGAPRARPVPAHPRPE